MSDIKITKDYIPGSLGRVAELHGAFYHAKITRRYTYGHSKGSSRQGIFMRKPVSDWLRSIKGPSGELKSRNNDSRAF